MSRRPLVIDVAVAAAIATVVLVLEPGVAVGVPVALALLTFCAATLAVDRRRSRRSVGARPRRR